MARLKIVVLAVLCFSTAASAGSVLSTVKSVRVDESGLGIVEFFSLLGGAAGCVGSGYEKSMAFDANTAGGKSILSAALTAKASGSTVYAIGTGACPIYGIVEKVREFRVQ